MIVLNKIQRPNPLDKDAPKKFYVSASSTGSVDLEEMSVNISERCTITEPDVLAVVSALTSEMTKQLMDAYERTHASNIAVMEVPHKETSKYGIIDPDQELEPGLFNVRRFVEKPKPEDAPSNLAIIGRYLLTPEIFEILENQNPGAGGEIQLTDAIDTLNQTQRVFAKRFDGKRFDVGDKFGFLTTSISYGLTHPEIKDKLKNYLVELGEKLTAEDEGK